MVYVFINYIPTNGFNKNRCVMEPMRFCNISQEPNVLSGGGHQIQAQPHQLLLRYLTEASRGRRWLVGTRHIGPCLSADSCGKQWWMNSMNWVKRKVELRVRLWWVVVFGMWVVVALRDYFWGSAIEKLQYNNSRIIIVILHDNIVDADGKRKVSNFLIFKSRKWFRIGWIEWEFFVLLSFFFC